MTDRLTPDVAVGHTVEAVVVDGLTRTQIVQYAGASGDFNPLHSDEVFAVKIGGMSRGVFAHGMLTMGMTGQLLTTLAGPENILRYGVRFKSQVWPGDTLLARATVTDVRQEPTGVRVELELTTSNADDAVVLSGYATVRVPVAD